MKIIVIGSTGVIGAAVARALAARHEVIGVTRSGTPPVDIEQPATVAALFQRIRAGGGVDAVVCCAGSGVFKPVAQLTDDDLAYALKSKLMGQVHVIRQAMQHVNDGGSVTVTTGVLAQHPMPGGAAFSMVNCGLEGFVRGAAMDTARGVRINVVSPPWVTETLIALKMDTAPGMPAAAVANAYVAAVEGSHQGETLDCRDFA